MRSAEGRRRFGTCSRNCREFVLEYTEEEWAKDPLVQQWHAICQENGHPGLSQDRISVKCDMDHSALLQRLRSGKDPLEHPPPLRMSYPWYKLIEDGEALVLEAWEPNDVPPFGGQEEVTKKLVIDQHRWNISSKPSDKEWIVWYRIPDETFRVTKTDKKCWGDDSKNNKTYWKIEMLGQRNLVACAGSCS